MHSEQEELALADRYLRFGTVLLPQRDGSHPIGTTKAESPVATTGSGTAYRIAGSDTVRGTKFDLKLSGKITTGTDWQYWTTLNDLRALRGKYDQLFRISDYDGTSVWAWAECAQVDSVRGTEHRRWIEASLDFNVYGDSWCGGAHSPGPNALYGTGVLFGSGRVFAANNGNAPVRDIQLTLTPGASITAFTLTGPGFGWTWNGTLNVGTQLIIDCGGKRIRTLTAGVYSPAYNLALDFTRMTSLDWVVLAAKGTTALTATLVGGGTTSTLGYTYSDRWY
jgi:hypothetical protein